MRSAFLLVLLAASACAAFAQKAPEGVTVRQIFQYQANIEKGCKDRGRQRGDAAADVDAFCHCMIERMRATVPVDAWQKAFFHSRQHEEQAERQALLPHLPNLQECRK